MVARPSGALQRNPRRALFRRPRPLLPAERDPHIIRVINGHVYLNSRPLNLRGVGLQEDSLQNGFAIDNATRARYIAEAKDLGATFIRSQYPLHPYEEELADQQGILLWSEIPVFSIKAAVLRSASFRSFAEDQLRQNIVDNGSHPSILVWSIANELSSRPGPAQKTYINDAVALAHRLDPSRPVSLAVAGYPTVPASRRTASCRSSASTTTSAGIPGRAARSPTAACSRATWTRRTPATRARACS